MPAKAAALRALIPWAGGLEALPDASLRGAWRGLGQLCGLPEVALVALPDLPSLFAPPPRDLPAEQIDEPREIFRPSGDDLTPPNPAPSHPPTTAPRLSLAGYRLWASALRAALDFLTTPRGGFLRRDVMLVAGLPLPDLNDPALASSPGKTDGWLAAVMAAVAPGLASPQLQLAFPWIMTPGSAAMPEGVENPDGALCGLLARNALTRGAFHSAASLPLRSARATEPQLARGEIETAPDLKTDWLGDRLTLIGAGLRGLALLSDSTTGDTRAERAAGVSRLTGILIRAARLAGEALLFEPSVEATWTRLRRRVEEMLEELWRLGALSGGTPKDAYEVRCDRTTMTQADIDAGRFIVRIDATASQPIERITVTLAFAEAGAAHLAKAA